ncbi:hypothetical protein AUK22_02105 [bacterium CG2_30_54_10]|nr:MAG: hypothetical protein AUK22_02105 [bacterium CG2_30_54_10]
MPFIIHHSSFIISSISTSPKFLRSPFFQTAKLLQKMYLLNKEGEPSVIPAKAGTSIRKRTTGPGFPAARE